MPKKRESLPSCKNLFVQRPGFLHAFQPVDRTPKLFEGSHVTFFLHLALLGRTPGRGLRARLRIERAYRICNGSKYTRGCETFFFKKRTWMVSIFGSSRGVCLLWDDRVDKGLDLIEQICTTIWRNKALLPSGLEKETFSNSWAFFVETSGWTWEKQRDLSEFDEASLLSTFKYLDEDTAWKLSWLDVARDDTRRPS